jgi:hypothetical protein
MAEAAIIIQGHQHNRLSSTSRGINRLYLRCQSSLVTTAAWMRLGSASHEDSSLMAFTIICSSTVAAICRCILFPSTNRSIDPRLSPWPDARDRSGNAIGKRLVEIPLDSAMTPERMKEETSIPERPSVLPFPESVYVTGAMGRSCLNSNSSWASACRRGHFTQSSVATTGHAIKNFWTGFSHHSSVRLPDAAGQLRRDRLVLTTDLR